MSLNLFIITGKSSINRVTYPNHFKQHTITLTHRLFQNISVSGIVNFLEIALVVNYENVESRQMEGMALDRLCHLDIGKGKRKLVYQF